MERARSVLTINEQKTDGMMVRAMWIAFVPTAIAIGLIYTQLVKADIGPFLVWIGISMALLLMPTALHWFRWLPGSVKYVGPLVVIGVLVAMAHNIHFAQSGWAIWLLPSLMAAL
ncbi:MAG TPA: hypothetical protein VD902_19680, partial [Symbiobacteriaceae bacterium]|nr:hypothetical protein [Symbiobacteriaceae bacterium]